MSKKNLVLYKEKIGCSIEDLVRAIEEILNPLKLKNTIILHRIKYANTLRRKMILKRVSSVFDIEDIFGLRILVNKEYEAYKILKILQEKTIGYLDHDFIKNPKTRNDTPELKGKSLKLLQWISYKNKIPFEIQITTFEFNRKNELLHNRYHKEKYD